MRKLSFFALAALAILGLFCFASCESPKTVAHGIPDVAYVQFVSSTRYKSVTVIFDGNAQITAKVNSAEDRTIDNDYNYAVTTGRHSMEVFDSNGKSILYKDIFVSAQEVRIIYLP